jgi:hypothetical protein
MIMNRVVMVQMKMAEEEFHRFDYSAGLRIKLQVGQSKPESFAERFAICVFFC